MLPILHDGAAARHVEGRAQVDAPERACLVFGPMMRAFLISIRRHKRKRRCMVAGRLLSTWYMQCTISIAYFAALSGMEIYLIKIAS